MNIVTIQCRTCWAPPASIPLELMEGDKPTIEESQQHINTYLKARCGDCLDTDWEVLKVKHGAGNQLHTI